MLDRLRAASSRRSGSVSQRRQVASFGGPIPVGPGLPVGLGRLGGDVGAGHPPAAVAAEAQPASGLGVVRLDSGQGREVGDGLGLQADPVAPAGQLPLPLGAGLQPVSAFGVLGEEGRQLGVGPVALEDLGGGDPAPPVVDEAAEGGVPRVGRADEADPGEGEGEHRAASRGCDPAATGSSYRRPRPGARAESAQRASATATAWATASTAGDGIVTGPSWPVKGRIRLARAMLRIVEAAPTRPTIQ